MFPYTVLLADIPTSHRVGSIQQYLTGVNRLKLDLNQGLNVNHEVKIGVMNGIELVMDSCHGMRINGEPDLHYDLQ